MFANRFPKTNGRQPMARLDVETLEERSLPSASPFSVSSIAVTGEDWPPPPATHVHVSLMTKSTAAVSPQLYGSIGEEIPTVTGSDASRMSTETQFWGSIGEEIPTAQSHDVGHVELFAQRMHIGEEIPQ